MKDVFVARYASEFQTLLENLVSSLEETLNRTSELTEFASQIRERTNEENMRAWLDATCSVLTRQHAKYVRAVASITGAPATVYHAIRYKDVSAIDACRNPLTPLSFSKCTKEMTSQDVDLLWRYMFELSDIAIRWNRQELPSVPTPTDISRDIANRRNKSVDKRDERSNHPPLPTQVKSLSQGVEDLWQQLCSARKVTVDLDDGLRDRIRDCVRNNSEITPQIMNATFPELGDSPFTMEECGIVERMKNLVTMDDSIPDNMMRGIEAVANRLVKDLNNGTCDLATLDLEGIGQQVISKVSDADMGTFAANIDKIIPALERAHRMS